MANLDSNSRFVVDHAAGTPDDPNLASLADLAAVLTTSTSVSLVASRLVSTSAAGSLDSVPVSTADSKAVSSGTRASVADSKAVSDSGVTSVADSKALSVSVNTSIADSKATSVATIAATIVAPITLPAEGRTTTTLATYLANNALYNVLDYAAGVSITGGSNSANSAIGLANAAAGTGKAIVFPPGTYKVTASITITCPVILLSGAQLVPSSSAVVVAFSKPVYPAGMEQCFSTVGRFTFTAGMMDAMRPEWWGARGDNTTDSTSAIQAAIDATIYGGAHCKVLLGPGRFKTTDTLHLGYGDSFRSVVLEGHGYLFSGDVAFNGTAILPTKYDRPCINIQGGRGTVVRNLAGKGILDTYIFAHSLGAVGGAASGYDDTLGTTWDDPAYGGATLDSRYAPYAFITVDAYAGTRPGTSYPDVTYPSWSGISTQYGKSNSSDTLIEDWMAQGFTVPICIQPADTDANGDFTNIRRGNVYACKYAVSIGNTQSRSVAIDDLKYALVHTTLTSNKHGRQTGKFDGTIKDLSGGGGINVVDFGSAYPGPVTFLNLQCEAQWRIGNIASTGASSQSYIFQGGSIGFEAQGDTRGYPAYVCASSDTGGGAAPLDIQFRGVTFLNYLSVCGLGHDGVVLDGCYFIPSSARTNPYEQFAHNAMAAGFFTINLRTPYRSRCRFTNFDLSTNLASTTLLTGKVTQTNRVQCCPWYAEDAAALSETYDTMGRPPVRTEGLDIGSLSVCTLVNGVLNITFAARASWQILQVGGATGDVLFHRSSGSVFFIRSQTGTSIIAELQNNYKLVGGVKTPINTINLASGTMDVRNSRLYTPGKYLRGDVTAASNVLTNCARDDGGASYDAEIAVGDALLVEDTRDNFLPITGADITARSQAAGTITVTSVAAAGRTQVRRRLNWFIRTGPANV